MRITQSLLYENKCFTALTSFVILNLYWQPQDFKNNVSGINLIVSNIFIYFLMSYDKIFLPVDSKLVLCLNNCYRQINQILN